MLEVPAVGAALRRDRRTFEPGRGVKPLLHFALAAMIWWSVGNAAEISLEAGFRDPPMEARPHTYWLWMNGHLDPPSAMEELRAMKSAGLSGVLLFEMGARGDKSLFPAPGPAFLSEAWLERLKLVLGETRRLGLQVDMSVISS